MSSLSSLKKKIIQHHEIKTLIILSLKKRNDINFISKVIYSIFLFINHLYVQYLFIYKLFILYLYTILLLILMISLL